MISLSFIVFLLYSQFLIYREFHVYQDIDIFHGKTDDKMLLNIGINLPKVSCYAIGIGLSDNKYVMIYKIRLINYKLITMNQLVKEIK